MARFILTPVLQQRPLALKYRIYNLEFTIYNLELTIYNLEFITSKRQLQTQIYIVKVAYKTETCTLKVDL